MASEVCMDEGMCKIWTASKKMRKKKEWACTIMVIFRLCKRVCQHVDNQIT